MKQRLRALKNWWLDSEGKMMVFAIVVGIATGIYFLATDNIFHMKETNYVALETIVHAISEQKNVVQPIDPEKVHSYNVDFTKKGDIIIELQGDRAELVKATLSSDYQLKSLERSNRISAFVVVFIFVCIIAGAIGGGILYILYHLILKFAMYQK